MKEFKWVTKIEKKVKLSGKKKIVLQIEITMRCDFCVSKKVTKIFF